MINEERLLPENDQETEVIVQGPEEYYGDEYLCRKCQTTWMSYDEYGLKFIRYCPGCGRKVSVII